MRGLHPGRISGIGSFLMVVLLLACGSASAATLVLIDGSVIQGDIVSLQDNVYTVESDALGTVHVRKQDVRSIDHTDQAALISPPERTDLQAMQLQMMQNPDLISMVTALRNDPDVQAVLSDPEVMSAMASGDFARLMNHPKIIALTRNAKIREVIEEVR